MLIAKETTLNQNTLNQNLETQSTRHNSIQHLEVEAFSTKLLCLKFHVKRHWKDINKFIWSIR